MAEEDVESLMVEMQMSVNSAWADHGRGGVSRLEKKEQEEMQMSVYSRPTCAFRFDSILSHLNIMKGFHNE